MEFSEFWRRLTQKNPRFNHPDAGEKIEIKLGEFRRLLYLAHSKGRSQQYADREKPSGPAAKLRETLQGFGVKF